MSQKLMRAVVVQPDRSVKVEYKPVPIPKPNELLLRIITCAQNPGDWKDVAFSSKVGDIVGCDAVGEVVEIGSDVPSGEAKLGELRSLFQRGGVSPTEGSFAEFVAFDWDFTSVVPSNVTPEQAATLPGAVTTIAQAFYYNLKLPEPIQPSSTPESPWLLVYSGASGVGQIAIQFAKLSGFNVIATASTKRHNDLKALGADVVIDYKDPDLVANLKKASGDRIAYGIDCFSEGGSVAKCQEAFQPSGGKLMTTGFDHSGLPRTDVETASIIGYAAFGRDVHFGEVVFPSTPENRAIHALYQKRTTELLRDGHLKPSPYELLGGLDDVQKGFELMKAGKNEHKIVYRV